MDVVAPVIAVRCESERPANRFPGGIGCCTTRTAWSAESTRQCDVRGDLQETTTARRIGRRSCDGLDDLDG